MKRSYHHSPERDDYSGGLYSQQIEEIDGLSEYLEQIKNLSSPKNPLNVEEKILKLKKIISDAKKNNIRLFERNPKDNDKNIFHYLSLIFKGSISGKNKEFIEGLIREAVDSGFDFFSRTSGKDIARLDPLQYAILKCNGEFAELLLKQLVDINFENIKKLLLSIQNFYQENKNRIDVSSKANTFLICTNISFLLIDEILKNRSINSFVAIEWNGLILSAIKNAIDSGQLSELEQKTNTHGDTLFLSAAYHCFSLETVKIFLENFNLENSRNSKFKSNFLHQLFRGKGRARERIEIFKLLLEKESAFDVIKKMLKEKDNRGNTPLVYAAENESVEVIEKIILMYPEMLNDSLNNEDDNLLFLVIKNEKIRGKLAPIILDVLHRSDEAEGYLSEQRGKGGVSALDLAQKYHFSIPEYKKKRGDEIRLIYHVEKRDYDKVRDKFESTEKDLVRIRAERDKFRKYHEEDQQALARIRQRRDEFQGFYEETKELLTKSYQERDEYEGFYRKEHEALSQLREKCDEVNGLYKSVQSELIELREKFTQTYGETQEILAKARQEFKRYHAEAQKRLTAAEVERDDAQSEKKPLEEQLAARGIFIKDLETQLREENEEAEGLRKKLMEQEESIKLLEKKNKKLNDDLKREKDKDKTELEFFVSRFKEVEKQLELSKGEKRKISEENGSLKEENKKLKLMEDKYHEASLFFSRSASDIGIAEFPLHSSGLKKKTSDRPEFMTSFIEEKDPSKAYKEVVDREEFSTDERKKIGRKGEEHAYKFIFSHYVDKFKSETTETKEGFKISGVSKKGIGKEVEVIWKNKEKDTEAPIDIIKKLNI